MSKVSFVIDNEDLPTENVHHYLNIQVVNTNSSSFNFFVDAPRSFRPYVELAVNVVVQFLYDVINATNQKDRRIAIKDLYSKDFIFWCNIVNLNPEDIRNKLFKVYKIPISDLPVKVDIFSNHN